MVRWPCPYNYTTKTFVYTTKRINSILYKFSKLFSRQLWQNFPRKVHTSDLMLAFTSQPKLLTELISDWDFDQIWEEHLSEETPTLTIISQRNTFVGSPKAESTNQRKLYPHPIITSFLYKCTGYKYYTKLDIRNNILNSMMSPKTFVPLSQPLAIANLMSINLPSLLKNITFLQCYPGQFF